MKHLSPRPLRILAFDCSLTRLLDSRISFPFFSLPAGKRSDPSCFFLSHCPFFNRFCDDEKFLCSPVHLSLPIGFPANGLSLTPPRFFLFQPDADHEPYCVRHVVFSGVPPFQVLVTNLDLLSFRSAPDSQVPYPFRNRWHSQRRPPPCPRFCP